VLDLKIKHFPEGEKEKNHGNAFGGHNGHPKREDKPLWFDVKRDCYMRKKHLRGTTD